MASSRKERSQKQLRSPVGEKKQQNLTLLQRLIPWLACGVLSLICFILLLSSIFPGIAIGICPERPVRLPQHCVRIEDDVARDEWLPGFHEYDCMKAPQAVPVVAHRMEGVKYPFVVALNNFGTQKRQLRPNLERLINGRLFKKTDVSALVQSIVEELLDARAAQPSSLMVDVGANIGTAAFAAAALGLRVLALEPVPDNMARLCDGVYLNRAAHLVKLHLAAASDSADNITLFKVPTRLDRSCLSPVCARLASSKVPALPTPVQTLRLDDIVREDQHVALLKIAVQGWELHVMRGAERLLRRPPPAAPAVLYEDDRILLRASNTTQEQIRRFLAQAGYDSCEKLGSVWQHCQKKVPTPA